MKKKNLTRKVGLILALTPFAIAIIIGICVVFGTFW